MCILLSTGVAEPRIRLRRPAATLSAAGWLSEFYIALARAAQGTVGATRCKHPHGASSSAGNPGARYINKSLT